MWKHLAQCLAHSRYSRNVGHYIITREKILFAKCSVPHSSGAWGSTTFYLHVCINVCMFSRNYIHTLIHFLLHLILRHLLSQCLFFPLVWTNLFLPESQQLLQNEGSSRVWACREIVWLLSWEIEKRGAR